MEDNQQKQEDSPEEILNFVKRIINTYKDEKEGPSNDGFLSEHKSSALNLGLDDLLLNNLEQYVEFKEEEQKENEIEIEEPEQEPDDQLIEGEKEQYQPQEKTEEEKEKWIDEVLQVNNDADDESSDDGNEEQMIDESQEKVKDDIYQMEKDFFEQMKKSTREADEKRQTQIEKNRRLYEDIIGEKHRKVQIIILSSTSSSQESTPRNQKGFEDQKIKEGEEQNNNSSNIQNKKETQNRERNLDFQVKEEYNSDAEEEDQSGQNVNRIEQENDINKREEEEYQQELKALFGKDNFDQKALDIEQLGQNIVNAMNSVYQQPDEQEQQNLGIPFGETYHQDNDYEQGLEDLLDRLYIK